MTSSPQLGVNVFATRARHPRRHRGHQAVLGRLRPPERHRQEPRRAVRQDDRAVPEPVGPQAWLMFGVSFPPAVRG
jgi:hypothetical protein